MVRLFLVGASGHAKTVLDAVKSGGQHEVVAIVDDVRPKGSVFEGFSILGPLDAECISCLQRDGVDWGVVCIGDNFARRRVVDRLSSLWPDVHFATIIHQSAVVSATATVSPGTVVLPGAVVQPGAVVGKHCILNTKSSLDHDSSMGDFSALAPGATICGNVQIGAGSVVCTGATVIHRRTIGAWTVVGAGSVVVRDIPQLVIAYGVPCRVKRPRNESDPYM